MKLEDLTQLYLQWDLETTDPISESLKDIVKETYVIGDAVRARRALNATAEALDVALSI